MTTPPSLRQRIRKIDLKSRRLVQTAFVGAYHSVYKGRGLTFVGVRPYAYGDDVRAMDWRVTARTSEPHIKLFVEERERVVFLLVDSSPSVLFGTNDMTKRDQVAELSMILAHSAILNQDRVGLLLFTDQIEAYVPPRKSRQHVQALTYRLLTHQPQGQQTDIAQALTRLNRSLRPGAIIFILSDFLADPQSYASALALTGQRHDVIAVVFDDPLERALPSVGLLHLQDAETGESQIVDTGSARWQADFKRQRAKFLAQRAAVFKRARAAVVDVPPDRDYVRALQRFFHQQALRR
ncbi:MAG: DUF58 domain-containing protein [Anaerolineae bacterium]|nr:DUF58 domain-containing protein [Anaerolineae bacterium]MDW8171392.1 DUF58 domain-containing protein [Anaerolineae bacterium]